MRVTPGLLRRAALIALPIVAAGTLALLMSRSRAALPPPPSAARANDSTILATTLSTPGGVASTVVAGGALPATEPSAGHAPIVIDLSPDEPKPEPTAKYASLREACDSVEALYGRKLQRPVTRADDTTLTNWSPRVGERGCVLRVEGTFRPGPQFEDPSGTIWRAFTDEGWVPGQHFMADGPDGGTFSMVSLGALCITYGEWDGGDDSDSTYVAGDWFTLRAECGDDVVRSKALVPDYP